MTHRSRRARTLLALALVLFAAGAQPLPVLAQNGSGVHSGRFDPPYTVGSGWQVFGWSGPCPAFNSEGPWTFVSATATTLRVTDALCAGDVFAVYDNGVPIGMTSPVPMDPACFNSVGNPDLAFGDPRYSRGTFNLPPGAHALTFQVIQSFAPGNCAGNAFFRVDCPGFTASQITFPSTLAGTMGATVCFPVPAGTFPAVLGAGFTIVPGSPGQVCVQFAPVAAACGNQTGLLIFFDIATACPLVIVPLQGFACSFTCAIGRAGQPGVLTAAGRQCVVGSLGVASTTTGLTRCAALRCAECCVLSDLASIGTANPARRAAAQAVLDQIRCLMALFGCAPLPC